MTTIECLEENDDCRGQVAYHSTDPGVRPAFPRCEHHWSERIRQEEQHRVNYPDSPIPPAWFDPMNAGEHWDYDY